MDETESTMKILIVGEKGVGKTSIVNQYYQKKFDKIIQPTNGTTFTTYTTTYNNQDLKL